MANDWCQLSVSDGLLERVGKTLHTDATANSLRAAVELFNGDIAAFAIRCTLYVVVDLLRNFDGKSQTQIATAIPDATILGFDTRGFPQRQITISITERPKYVIRDKTLHVVGTKPLQANMRKCGESCSMHLACFGGYAEQPSFVHSRSQHENRSALNIQLSGPLHWLIDVLRCPLAALREVLCNPQKCFII